jgi:type IV pilus assembly protein PilW
MTTLRSRPHGFTLVELLISLVVVAFMVGGAMALLGQQQRAFENSAADRALQETARTALSDLGQNLRRAGYGIEPWLAFDFGPMNIAATGTTPAIAALSYKCTTADPSSVDGNPVTCRDSIARSDEIVFYARDPSFGRQLPLAPAGTTLTVAGGFKDTVYPGQVMQVMCASAAAVAYVMVAQRVDPNWVPPAAPPASTAVQLTADAAAFPRQTSLLASPGSCFQTDFANAKVFWIDRFRYYVAQFVDSDTGVNRPYLMLDRGLTDSGRALVEPVAPDVEDLQIGYLFPNSPGVAQQMVGAGAVAAAAGPRLASSASSVNISLAPPGYADLATAASRQTQSPANIRGVRVSLVVRNPGPNITLPLQNVPAAGNRPTYAGQPYYRYLLIETTEATRNLGNRFPFFPYYSTSAGADFLNLGGG